MPSIFLYCYFAIFFSNLVVFCFITDVTYFRDYLCQPIEEVVVTQRPPWIITIFVYLVLLFPDLLLVLSVKTG